MFNDRETRPYLVNSYNTQLIRRDEKALIMRGVAHSLKRSQGQLRVVVPRLIYSAGQRDNN